MNCRIEEEKITSGPLVMKNFASRARHVHCRARIDVCLQLCLEFAKEM